MDGQLTQERRRSTARVTDVARLSTIFEQIERAIGVGIGILLCLAATLALAGAVTLAWDGVIHWPQIRSLFGIVDRLLFVLMVIEILHTVRTSIQCTNWRPSRS